MNEQARMIRFLQEHDPVGDDLQDELRVDLLHQAILARVRVSPQEKPFSFAAWVRGLADFVPVVPQSYRLQTAMAAVCLLLLSGIWVGRIVDNTTVSSRGVAQAQSEQHISVVAMASPWEGWIEGGE